MDNQEPTDNQDQLESREVREFLELWVEAVLRARRALLDRKARGDKQVPGELKDLVVPLDRVALRDHLGRRARLVYPVLSVPRDRQVRRARRATTSRLSRSTSGSRLTVTWR